jgi:hypothetical protein
MNQLHTLISYFFMVHFNNILQLNFFRQFLWSTLYTKFSSLPSVLRSSPSQFSWLIFPDSIRWRYSYEVLHYDLYEVWDWIFLTKAQFLEWRILWFFSNQQKTLVNYLKQSTSASFHTVVASSFSIAVITTRQFFWSWKVNDEKGHKEH